MPLIIFKCQHEYGSGFIHLFSQSSVVSDVGVQRENSYHRFDHRNATSTLTGTPNSQAPPLLFLGMVTGVRS